ncbi:MAG: exonuclease SbcCD subunit D [Hyphomicrobiaceae bacterium]
MAFTFVHTADWQIGKTFGGFPEDKAAILKRARLDAVARIAAQARTKGAAHVLVAGDIFDAETLPDQTLREALSIMRKCADLTWHLLPGNHDPARPGGLWQRVRALGGPLANVRAHDTQGATEIAPGVHLLAAPLTSRAASGDPTAWMDSAATPEGALRIGLAHGSVQGFGSLGEAAVQIAQDRPERAGLAYLALGDWHGARQIGPRVWYSGTPEPDRYVRNEPGHALVVRLASPSAAPEVERVATAEFHWSQRAVQLDSLADIEAVAVEVAALGAASRSHLLALELAGQLSLAEHSALEARLEALAAELFWLEHDAADLHVAADGADEAMIGGGVIGEVAARLRAVAAADDAQARAVAELALRKLYGYARQAGEGRRS